MALAVLQSLGENVAGLITGFDPCLATSGMHGVPVSLIEQQARAIGIPLYGVPVPKEASNQVFEAAWTSALQRVNRDGGTIVWGDLFLEEIRAYRERVFSEMGWKSIFPLWGVPTTEQSSRFIDMGFEAIVCCIDGERLTGEFVGEQYGRPWLDRLPAGIDFCGENGEFHTFVTGGPIFQWGFPVRKGGTTYDGRFWRTELF